jgi:glycosyltransferase involved in cell wall biosynthesis
VRVLHVEGGSRLYGGAQQVLYLLEGLADRGVENLLACPAGCDLAGRAAPFAEVHAMRMGGDLDLGIALRLAQLIRSRQPDLVHLHSRIGADVMGGLAARWRGVPAIHTRRVDNPEPRWVAAPKYRLHRRVIAISEGIARVLRDTGLPEAKLRVVRSAVPVAEWDRPCRRADFLPALGLPDNALSIGVIAQLIPRKGHRVLLDALPALLPRHAALHVVFFGQGPDGDALRQRVVAAGLAGRVHFAGFRDDLPALVPCLDLVVHPALLEGLGVSLMQAAAAGRPIVASRTGGIPEIVHDQENGLLVPPGDAARLGAAIGRLLANEAMRQRLGSAGHALMVREHGVDAMVEGNLAVYREVLAE